VYRRCALEAEALSPDRIDDVELHAQVGDGARRGDVCEEQPFVVK